MKSLLALITLFSSSLYAQTIVLKDHNWSVPDVSARRTTKEKLYDEMDREVMRLNDSICSNRALMWGYDFKRREGLDTAKIFLFYTERNSQHRGLTWWYHVSPLVNEKGQLWVMDAGFPDKFNSPLTIHDWLKEFTEEDECKQITMDQPDLVAHIFREEVFPVETKYGSHGCYYIIAPAPYWTPGQVATNLLGRDERGETVRFSREKFDLDEVFSACLEAVTTPLGRILGRGKKQCAFWVGYGGEG